MEVVNRSDICYYRRPCVSILSDRAIDMHNLYDDFVRVRRRLADGPREVRQYGTQVDSLLFNVNSHRATTAGLSPFIDISRLAK